MLGGNTVLLPIPVHIVSIKGVMEREEKEENNNFQDNIAKEETYLKVSSVFGCYMERRKFTLP